MYEYTTVERKGQVEMSANMDALHVNETYEGGDNPISMSSVYQGDFMCSFDAIRRYPFDIQFCSVKVFIQGAQTNFVNLSPQTIIDNGPSEVGQYQVKRWLFEDIKINNGKKELEFTVQLHRNILSIFFITYQQF